MSTDLTVSDGEDVERGAEGVGQDLPGDVSGQVVEQV